MWRAENRISGGIRSLTLYASLAAHVGAAETIRSRVLLDDVIPPSSPIAVRLLCGEAVVAETAADDHGRFDLPAPPKGTDAKTCRLTASATGYEADTVALPHLPLNSEIASLALKRAGKYNGYALSSTSLAVDAPARALFARAVRSMRDGGQEGMAKAEKAFEEATQADPSFAEAWYQLGRMRLARQEIAGGREALRGAVEADPWYISPYRPLLLLELGEERWREVVELSAELLALNPYLADIRYYRGLASLALDDLDAADREVAAILSGPEAASFTPVRHLQGLVLERQGRQVEAAAAFREYLAAEPEGSAAADVRRHLEALEKP